MSKTNKLTQMNWLKRLYRSYLIASILIFFSIIIASVLYHPGEINPEYKVWYNEHGESWKAVAKDEAPLGKLLKPNKVTSTAPVPPPIMYLPVPISKAILDGLRVSIPMSLILFFGLVGITKLINFIRIWINGRINT